MKLDSAVILLCVIRLLGNMIWPLWDDASIYYVSQGIFEAGVLFIFTSLFMGWQKDVVTFFLGLSCFSLLKEFWHPTVFDVNEYIGLFVGLGFVLYQKINTLWKIKNLKKR